jgi:hypothetical protein
MTSADESGHAPSVAGGSPQVRPGVYGRNYSYFSHRIFVAFMPEDLHKYLHERLTQVDANGVVVTSATDPAAHSDAIDLQIVRWVLLHRSQLNALSLNRELEAWRGADDLLMLPPDSGLRSDDAYRLDITLQIAIELALADALHNDMLKNRPRLQLALIDAAYFISRRRNEQDWMLGEAIDGRDVDIDLSESGREAFEAYLVQRMNLDEDKVVSQAESAWPEASRSAGRGPLSVKEVNWLHGVAIGVARTLSSGATSTDLRNRWDKALGERWKARGLPLPDSTPFEAMLTGSYAPLIALTADDANTPHGAGPGTIETFQYRWRVAQFAGAPWAQSLIGIAEQSEPACDFIERVDLLLRRVMFGPEVAALPPSGPETQPLRLLSDRYRVLPTTPAWAAVSEAIARMRHARKGMGNTSALIRDGRLLEQYAQMLRAAETADAVGLMLAAGAALAGMQAGKTRLTPAGGSRVRPQAADWTVALTAIHDGLRLDGVDVLTASALLDQVYGYLTQIAPGLPARHLARPASAPLAGDVSRTPDDLIASWPLPGELDDIVVKAFESGWVFAGRVYNASWMIHEAWRRLEERLQQLAFGQDGTVPAHASELACAMLGIGPGPALPLRLGEAGARIWTEVLLTAVLEQRASPSSANPYGMPVSLVAHALERLGVRSLRIDVQQAVLEALVPAEAPRKEIHEYVERFLLWKGDGLSCQVALVVGPWLESMAEDWPMPPTGGLVLAAADINRQRLEAAGLDAIIRAEAVELRVAFEPWMARASETEQLEAWVRNLPRQSEFIRLWLYRSWRVGLRKPQLVDPESPDELWNWGAADESSD